MDLKVKGDLNTESSSLASYFFSSLVFAPLKTVGISMQLSVLGHKELYGSLVEKTVEGLIKTPTELTVQEKRKYEMMIKVSL